MRGTNEKITEDQELRHQHPRCRIRSQQAENRPLGGMPQAPGRLAQPEAKVRELNGSTVSSASGRLGRKVGMVEMIRLADEP